MSNGWQNKRLDEIISLQRGHDLPTQDRVEGNIPIMGSFGITGWHNKFKSKGPGVTIGRSGGSMGVVNFIKEDYWPLNTALYVTDFKLNDPFFVSLLLRQIDFMQYNSGSAQPSLNRNIIYGLELRLPPLQEQKAIAHILGTLDDKIEVNRQMNQTLEAMAQALFKSWFVDFDPVMDNALASGQEIPDELQAMAEKRSLVPDNQKLLSKNPGLAALFPSSFVFNETLGKWIPEGWEEGKLGDRYFVKGGFAFKSKDFVEENGIPIVKIKSIKGDNTVDKSDLSMVKTSVAKQRQDFWLNNGDILMAMTGATVGKFGVLVKDEDELIVLNQRVAKFYSAVQDLRTIWFVYCYFNDSINTDFIVNTAQGSAQPNISANEIMSAPIVKPNISLLVEFEKIVSNSFHKILENQKQTQTLIQLRERLLPELISGRVRVNEGIYK